VTFSSRSCSINFYFPLSEDHRCGVLLDVVVAILELILLEEVEHAAAAVALLFVFVFGYGCRRLLQRECRSACLGRSAREVFQSSGIYATRCLDLLPVKHLAKGGRHFSEAVFW